MPDAVSYERSLKGRHLIRTLLITAIFNTAIAGLLTIMGFRSSFGVTWLVSQCIGLTICLCVIGAMRLFEPQQRIAQAITVLIAITVGALIGMTLGSLANWLVVEDSPLMGGFTLQIVGISMLFGMAITYFFHSREKLAVSKDMINQERIKRLSSEKQMLEANLKRLQAQVEPHFLFNTLSNIVSLIDTDPAKAKAMQLDLIRYLRSSLALSRDQETTLGEMFERMRAYLDIFKIRMGDRLKYDLNLPDSLADHGFAPMLLQPLVENAIIHGLEPLFDGGRISIRAEKEAELLRLVVSDTGCGMGNDRPAGLGLSNVKARIASLFGPRGRLLIQENQSAGLRAVIEVPASDNHVHALEMEKKMEQNLRSGHIHAK